MYLLITAGILFLGPLVIGVAGGVQLIAAGAADLATRRCSDLIRLCAIAAAAALAAILWSSVIVWISSHTMLLRCVPAALCYGLVTLLGLLPPIYALYGLFERDDQATSPRKPVERPALMIAVILNAIFLGVMLI